MIDFSKLEQYRENNRIEAKKALGGLPKSIWETYSAFANTYGGIILLGVEERADKSLHPVDLPDPDRLIREFWDIVNNPNKTSVNILSARDVFVQEVDGAHIVVIRVPRAERSYKPVYVDGNPLCTYRRNGEGDYRCTREEYQAMVRDASVRTQDMLVLNEMDLGVFHPESVRSYRQRMRLSRPGHVWESLEDEEFLLKLGAVGIGSDGKKHPTSAGLLMFGNEYDIVREFNAYFLDYQEQYDADTRWTDRIISSSGDWSGNVYDFYFRIYNRLIQDIKVPFRMDGGNRVQGLVVDAEHLRIIPGGPQTAPGIESQPPPGHLRVRRVLRSFRLSEDHRVRLPLPQLLQDGCTDAAVAADTGNTQVIQQCPAGMSQPEECFAYDIVSVKQAIGLVPALRPTLLNIPQGF